MFTKTYHRVAVALLLSSLLFALFACSKGEQDTHADEAVVEQHDHDADHTMTTELAEKTASKAWNKICPVCGGEVDATLKTVTYDGKIYGFGCPGCPEDFSKNPQKYVGKLNEDGTALVES
ncbi:MAG: YHS domain-containing protein [bacterium]